jgi:hypothetical protein
LDVESFKKTVGYDKNIGNGKGSVPLPDIDVGKYDVEMLYRIYFC